MNRLRLGLLLGILSIATGCITPWKLSNGGLLNRSTYSIKVTTPKGWYARTVNTCSLFTRNGLSLDGVVINGKKWSDTLSNGFCIPSNILLHQIPKLLLGEFCANGSTFNLNVESNAITTIDGYPCTKTIYRYTAPNSLAMKGILYCIPFKQRITTLYYDAEASHYYNKSEEDFTTMVNSIRIKKKRYKSQPGITVTTR